MGDVIHTITHTTRRYKWQKKHFLHNLLSSRETINYHLAAAMRERERGKFVIIILCIFLGNRIRIGEHQKNAASDARCPSALKLNYISERARVSSQYDETLGGGTDVRG